ncbi:MAG: tRNA pseudouridine(13) synthase TruD [Gammaproteobacteria bacterium]|nr:tRNA pseudouridine(13) synthase TruD [Gammaproteobacteria bacterium]
MPSWQHSGGRTTATGQLRVEPQDFEVVEIPSFELQGEGEHDYLYIEKTDANTPWVARALARHAAVPVRDVGYAGMKDRRAVTRQWFSVRRPGGVKADWQQLALEGVSVLEIRRHNRKLRRGAHHGNRFKIRIRDLSDPDSTVQARLEAISEAGVPNYFGEQRFGRNGSNIGLAERLFARKRMPREQRSIALSAARALIFNEVLSARVLAGNWNTILAGEVANLDGSGSLFPVTDADTDLQQRCRDFDIHPTGPLWGKGAPTTIGEVAEIEMQAAAHHEKLTTGLEKMTDEGRRALRLVVRDLNWEWRADNLVLEFSLFRGGFATAVLREILSYTVPRY